MPAFTTPESFDDAMRETGALSRRRSLLALGGAGLLAVFAGHSTADAGRKRKKGKKQCKREQQRCVSKTADFCAAEFEGALRENCERVFLPCCETCKVDKAMLCVAAAISPEQ